MKNFIKDMPQKKDRVRLVDELTDMLVVLRTKADISQEDVAYAIGVSRQTYGAIERRDRRMTWNTYLSLILLYDYNGKTRSMLRSSPAFPSEMERNLSGRTDSLMIDSGNFMGKSSIMDCLDDQAIRSIQTMIMVEYARCASLPCDVVVRAFDGVNLLHRSPSADGENEGDTAKNTRRKKAQDQK